jgi:hypothetical protein
MEDWSIISGSVQFAMDTAIAERGWGHPRYSIVAMDFFTAGQIVPTRGNPASRPSIKFNGAWPGGD